MANQNELNWYSNYEALKVYIAEHHHLPPKHRTGVAAALLSWAKYQRKKINAGTLSPERKKLFLELLATRSNEHTGGRTKSTEKKKN